VINPYFSILVLFLIAGLFAGVFLTLSYLIGPKKYNKSKFSAYECGIDHTVGGARERFAVKFFLVAIIFIVFDIEVVFLFPWAVLFKQFVSEGMGHFMLAEMGVFVGILVLGFAYIWRKGVLDWNTR